MRNRHCSAILFLLAASLQGCASKPAHIAQLAAGMTRVQVEDVQGKPVKVETAGKYTALHYEPDFLVILEDDRVIAFGKGELARYPGSDRYLIKETSP